MGALSNKVEARLEEWSKEEEGEEWGGRGSGEGERE